MNRRIPPDRDSGLPPLVGPDPHILILGSFPSRMSLHEGRYYANPKNQFWIIMQNLLGLKGAGIPDWEEELLAAHVAIWDVIASRRYQEGSMDRDIRDEILNDIPSFLARHPTIQGLLLNGGKSADSFRKAMIGERLPPGTIVSTLPSSSPANARYSLYEKIERWKIILEVPYYGDVSTRDREKGYR